MSIATFKKAAAKAQKICEDAATVAALTREYGKEPTTFVFPAAGILYGQLVTSLRHRVSPATQIVREGDNVRVVTTNPTAAVQVLKQFGVATTVDGATLSDVHVDNRDATQA
ncbi:hypothetical protein [Ralstonia phage RP13]|nr:hypothetical protein [Ralstonia phage RP13]